MWAFSFPPRRQERQKSSIHWFTLQKPKINTAERGTGSIIRVSYVVGRDPSTSTIFCCPRYVHQWEAGPKAGGLLRGGSSPGSSFATAPKACPRGHMGTQVSQQKPLCDGHSQQCHHLQCKTPTGKNVPQCFSTNHSNNLPEDSF